MSEPRLKQRLVAILAADAVGYSRLMSGDEHATVAALDSARTVFRQEVEAGRGRVIDMAGDSVLAVFETAAGAVAAALAIQQQLATFRTDIPDDQRMRFRIGVHLGDVIEKTDGTVYGDGVNIAARLQSLARPGGIAVSESIHTAVKGKITGVFNDVGLQQVKHFPDPVRTYRLEPEGRAATLSPPTGETILSLPERPSVAVLPFTNIGGDPEQEYLADGIVEDIITELSRFQRLFVIARNTSFTYKGRSVDAKTVARELGVHFVVEGSVRKAGDRVRITAQLIDGGTGLHVWAERYEDVLSDVFDLQETITRQIVARMVPEIEAQEMRLLDRGQRRFTDADEMSWRAVKALTDSIYKGEPALSLEAIRLAEQAIERDRDCRLAWSIMSEAYAWRVFFGWAVDRPGALNAARRAAEILLTLAPNDAVSYGARGVVEFVSGNAAAATAYFRRAHELNPNNATILFGLSVAEAATGNADRATAVAVQALRISPKDRWVRIAHVALAMCAFIQQDFARLRECGELAIQSNPMGPTPRLLMIVYAAEVGATELMRVHLEKLQSFAPDFIPSLLRGDYRPFSRPEHMALLLDGLRKAGF